MTFFAVTLVAPAFFALALVAVTFDVGVFFAVTAVVGTLRAGADLAPDTSSSGCRPGGRPRR